MSELTCSIVKCFKIRSFINTSFSKRGMGVSIDCIEHYIKSIDQEQLIKLIYKSTLHP